MSTPIRVTWRCNKCKDIVVSYSNKRHDMNYCKCGYSAVDLEDYYQRGMGDITELNRMELEGDKWVSVHFKN